MGTLNVRVLVRPSAERVLPAHRFQRAVPILSTLVALAMAIGSIASVHAQTTAGPRDPGVRGGSIDVGAAYSALTPSQQAIFGNAKEAFAEIGSVQGKLPGTGAGLGPRYNGVSCADCHAQPAMGGSSPSAKVFPNIGPNPQVAAANLQGATNRVPYFIRGDGPVREARFKRVVRNGALTDTPDGGVHALYTITGRLDATHVVGATGVAQTCRLAQPDFDLMRRLDNVEFRIPTPVYGVGLIESITDKAILDNLAAQTADKRNVGISGRPNRNGNDGTITRFGWKAQNASLMLFAGEAYNVEQGVTNELFPFERASPGEVIPPECVFNGGPEDTTNLDDPNESPHGDLVLFSMFMRFLAPPTPSTTSPGGATSIRRGAALFRDTVKCALCHTPSLPVGWSSFSRALGPTQANLYSDLLLHDMGDRLADGVSQGQANGNEFRTAPLWGLGQRVFFLHDGRTSDLVEAILAHGGRGSEARGTVDLFQRLNDADKQHLLNFLRSL